MSFLNQVLNYGKEVILLTQRIDRLLEDRQRMLVKLEEQERRLVRIETVLEYLTRARRPPRE